MQLRVHALMECSTVNGPGVRAVIWVQGCSLGCPGCWNAQTHAPLQGFRLDVLLESLIGTECRFMVPKPTRADRRVDTARGCASQTL
ncbi:MAG: 4Fe-4S cluster-binding domain-containing protein [Pirellulaceae bacterium]